MILNHTEIITTSSIINVDSHNIIHRASLVHVQGRVAFVDNGVFVKGKIRSLKNEKNNNTEACY